MQFVETIDTIHFFDDSNFLSKRTAESFISLYIYSSTTLMTRANY